MSEFELPQKEWADLNYDRYQANESDPRVIGFVHEDMFITNPFYDSSMIEEVDPFAEYGALYIAWANLHDKQRMEAIRAKDSNS